MKNRNIQFKPTAGLLIPLLLACFAAVFISAPTPAVANGHDDDEPFSGTVSGTIPADLVRPCPARTGAFLASPCPIPETRISLGASPGPQNSSQTSAMEATLAPFNGWRPTAIGSPALSEGN